MTETCCSRLVMMRRAVPSTSPLLSGGAAHVLALAAWQRDDVHDAMRWLGGTSPTRDTAFA